MEEEVEDVPSQERKKYIYEWRNKWITSRAETIDDFIKIYESLTGKLKRWKSIGIGLDQDVLSITTFI